MSKKDTDDVLDFINSLPDSKSNTPAQKKRATESSSEFLDFLDELNAHEKSPRPAGSRAKFEPKKKEEPRVKDLDPAPFEPEPHMQPEPAVEESEGVAPTKVESQSETTGSETSGAETGADTSKEEAEEKAIDPIASISSWWSTEGSNKVSSLWGSLTSNAHQLSEQTYQIASSTSQQLSHQRQKLIQEQGVADGEHILNITDRLNSMLTTMSQQIKEGLIDKEDELLNILLVYDLNNVAYLDRLCAQKFNTVMGQVEGGIKVTVNNFNHKHENVASGRDYYDLGMFYGKAIDGEKLCFANLESSIKDYVKITDAADEVADKQQKSETTEEDKDEQVVTKSNVFIAIQPISTGSLESAQEASGPSLIEASNANSFAFTMILKDISNNITIVSKSQPFPLRWARWVAGERGDVEAVFGVAEEGEEAVDPSEWVKGWLKDGLALSFAVLAQEYVTKRMGM